MIIDNTKFNRKESIMNMCYFTFIIFIFIYLYNDADRQLSNDVVGPMEKMVSAIERLTKLVYTLTNKEDEYENEQRSSFNSPASPLYNRQNSPHMTFGGHNSMTLPLARDVQNKRILKSKSFASDDTEINTLHLANCSIEGDIFENCTRSSSGKCSLPPIIEGCGDHERRKMIEDCPPLKSLEKCLKDRLCVKYYRMFLLTEWSVENLLFLQRVQYFEDCARNLESLAHVLKKSFIDHTSDGAINIPSQQRQDILAQLSEMAKLSFCEIFKVSKEEIYKLLNQGSFDRFRLSKFGKECANTWRTKSKTRLLDRILDDHPSDNVDENDTKFGIFGI